MPELPEGPVNFTVDDWSNACCVIVPAMSTTPSSTEFELRAPEHQVNRRAIAWWSLRAGAGWAAVIAASLVVSIATSGAVWIWISAGAIIVGCAHVLVMPQWRYRVHRWSATGTAVYTLTGWFHQEWRIVPVSRIQTIDVARGPLERWLRLSTVTVTTASAAGPVRISGLDHTEASRLVGELTGQVRDSSGDAT
jgi:membrane protein YdbS with pleckstrin-like domain